jgi:tight adherence protein B
MKWLETNLEGAGLAKYGVPGFLVFAVFVSVFLAASVYSILEVLALSVFLALGSFAFLLEAVASRAKARRRNLMSLWPEIIDSIHTAVIAGLTLSDAFDDLAISGPLKLRAIFQRFSARLDSGWSFDDSIEKLKSEFGDVHADRLCEILRLVSNSGSEALSSTLKIQSENLRRELALRGQIDAKQGWVVGTAKISVAAPWLVVAMLSMRPESALAYNSIEGVSILLLGFVVSMLAYRLVQFLGSLPEMPRVFT